MVSAGPQGASITIYRDEAIPNPADPQWRGYGLAMINETRVVELPAGETRLVFEDVADGILAQTAKLQGLPGETLEQNFDFNLLGPASLIEHSLGETIEVVRTNPKTGKRTSAEAVLRSGPAGVTLDFGDHVEALGCSGLPEGLVFSRLPPGLVDKPTLSIRVRVERPGRYRLKLSYLAINFAWRAAYVARLDPEGGTLALTGWITLANHGDVSIARAPTSVVAGRLARQAVELVRRVMARRAKDCWALGNSHHPHGERLYLAEQEELQNAEIVVTGIRREQSIQKVPLAIAAMAEPPPPAPRAQESDLGDYKLYTLDEPTTVAARQTKQVVFLEAPAVKLDVVQAYRVAGYTQPDQAWPTVTTLRLENKAAKGLGHALPAGTVSFRTPGPAGELYLGEHDIRDVPVGEPFEIEMGDSSLVTVRERTVSVSKTAGGHAVRIDKELTAANDRATPATVEIRQWRPGRDFRIVTESEAHGLKSGDPIWRLTLPPGAQATLTYGYEFTN